MNNYNFLFIFFFTIFVRSGLYGAGYGDYESVSIKMRQQDTLRENQILFNGREWRNHYYRMKGDQFLFTTQFVPGTVTINGRSFTNISIRYDIYSDEIITLTKHGEILQMNKEVVDSFNIIYQNKIYHFTNIQQDLGKGFNGYVNVLYNGETTLYVKYKKKIQKLAVENKFDMFYEIYNIFFVKDSIVYLITSKSDLFDILIEDKVQIKNYIKKNRLKVSKKKPESLIPVIAFYESINQ